MNVFTCCYNRETKDFYLKIIKEHTYANIAYNIEDYSDFSKIDEHIENINIIIVHQKLPNVTRVYDLIDKLKTYANNKRIIFIIDSHINPKPIQSYLIAAHIYDFLIDDPSNPNLKNNFNQLLHKPNRYQDVSDLYSESYLKTVIDDRYKPKVKTKIVTKTKIVNKKEILSYKKLVVSVVDNAEFSSELSFVIAKHTDLKVVVVDVDLLSPKIHLFLNVPPFNSNFTYDGLFTNSSLNVFIELIKSNKLASEFIEDICIKKSKNLFVVPSNNNLYNYELYKKENIIELINSLYNHFDIVVLNTNKSIYDLFAVISWIKSDYVFVPQQADTDVIIEYNNYIQFVCEKQSININKFKFVSFSYNNNYNLFVDQIKSLTSSYLTSIPYSHKREIYKNKKIPFAKNIDTKTFKAYVKIMYFLNISKKLTISYYIKAFILNSYKYFKITKRYVRIKTKLSIKLIKKLILKENI